MQRMMSFIFSKEKVIYVYISKSGHHFASTFWGTDYFYNQLYYLIINTYVLEKVLKIY